MTDKEKPLPGIGAQAANFGKALVRSAVHVAKGGDLRLEEEEQEDRRSICESNICGNYRASDDRCADCGCFLADKIPLAAEYCPLMMWPGDNLKNTDGDQDEQEEITDQE
jgi:hypothetical protein